MGGKSQYVVWVWNDSDGNPKYVGWGKYFLKHPAKHVWALRERYLSDLNIWLRFHDHEPDRKNLGVRYPRDESSWIASQLRRRYKDEGYDLLDSRPINTKKGGGRSRGVLSPDLLMFDSVREAARNVGVNPCTITRYCQAEDSGWDYID